MTEKIRSWSFTFGTYKDAAKWVAELGLKEGYTEQNHRALYRAFSPEA